MTFLYLKSHKEKRQKGIWFNR